MNIVDKIVTSIVNPAVAVLGTLAVLLFLWGVFELIYHADDEEALKKGKMHLLYGIFGIFVLVSARSIVFLLKSFFRAG